MVVMASLSWPVQGTIDFLRNPRWWGWPMLVLILVGVSCFSLAILLLLAMRPEPDAIWWQALLRWLLAVATAVVGAVATWLMLQPLILSLIFERLVLRVQREAGATSKPEDLLPGLLSALRVVVSTFPLRAATIVIAFIGPLLAGPAGIIAAAVAVSYVALFDACDVALAARGFDGARRLELMRDHRRSLRRVLLPATGLNLLLSLSIIGWFLWLPGLVVGAAREVLSWPAHATHDEDERLDRDNPASTRRISAEPPPT